MTIQDYIRKYYPDHWNSGKWGCSQIGGPNLEDVNLLKEDYPHGFQVSVSDTKKYWVWFDHD